MNNLYRVYNGYTGFDAVHVLVIANCESLAIDMAREAYRAECPDPRYWETLSAELIFNDTSKLQCSEVVG